jgi:rod shape determining protein RodA
VGVITIYSATYTGEQTLLRGLAGRQLYWFLIGLGAMVVFFSFDYHHIDRIAYPFYGVVLSLLVLVDAIGVVGGGSQRWLNLGFFSLQPSEISKLAIVWLLARFLKYDEPPEGYRLRDLRTPTLLAVPAILLVPTWGRP